MNSVLPDEWRVFKYSGGEDEYVLARSPEEVLQVLREVYLDDFEDEDTLPHIEDITEKSHNVIFRDENGKKVGSMYAEAVRVFQNNGRATCLASTAF